jgi:hypothetical protein
MLCLQSVARKMEVLHGFMMMSFVRLCLESYNSVSPFQRFSVAAVAICIFLSVEFLDLAEAELDLLATLPLNLLLKLYNFEIGLPQLSFKLVVDVQYLFERLGELP